MRSNDNRTTAMQSVGIDQVSISQMELFYADAADCERFLTPQELHDIGTDKRRGKELAIRWCVKEAVLKTIGGIQQGISMKDIEVSIAPNGQTDVAVSGHAHEVARSQRIEKWLVSTAHAGGIAMAFAIALGG